MTLSLLLALATGLLVGGVAMLKIVAPATKNTVDDKVLEEAEKVEDLAKSAGLIK